MAVPTETLKLVSQLALGARWLHLDDDSTSPVHAACEVLGIDPDDARKHRVEGVIDAAPGLDWTEQVALAIHLLLAPDDGVTLLAA